MYLHFLNAEYILHLLQAYSATHSNSSLNNKKNFSRKSATHDEPIIKHTAYTFYCTATARPVLKSNMFSSTDHMQNICRLIQFWDAYKSI